MFFFMSKSKFQHCMTAMLSCNVGQPTLSTRLFDFYEYMYTAQSCCGFVFISLGDTSAAAPLHLFHLRRLRLALQVRSHHASMLAQRQSNAKRDHALPSLHPSFSTGNFHWFPVFCIFLFFIFALSLGCSYHYLIFPVVVCFCKERTGVNTAPGAALSLTLCQNRCASGQEVWGRCWMKSRLVSVAVKMSVLMTC